MEAGTFMGAGLMTGGDIEISGLEFGLLGSFFYSLRKIKGKSFFQNTDGIIHVESEMPWT
jgi:UDP-N-acetylglucosamine enolpyruvyl transferase